MPIYLLLSVLLVSCAGESLVVYDSEPGLDPCGKAGMRQDAATSDRWSPESLGALARWSADARFVTTASGDVSRWQDHVDGRSGVLVQPSAGSRPQWISARGPCGMPAAYFDFGPFLQEETNAQATGLANVIAALAGSGIPFSALMTVQLVASPQDAYNPLLTWADTGSTGGPGAAYTRILVEGDKLQVRRRDNSGGLLFETGTIELGTAIRRLGAIFDGVRVRTFIDVQADLNANINSGLVAQTFTEFKVGEVAEVVSHMYVTDITILPRAIGYNEWLRYYEWSIRRWGAIRPPSFVAAGTGSNSVTSPTPAYPAGIAAGDLFVLHVVVFAETQQPATPAGWTLWDEDTNGVVKSYTYFRDARATGSESGTITVTIASGNFVNMARIYAFRAVSVTATASGYIDAQATTSGSDGTVPGPTLNQKGYGRLGIALVSVNDDSGMAAIVGATGGTWAEAVAEHTSGLGGGMQLQVVALRDPAPISGGTATVGVAGKTTLLRAYALLGE